MKTVLHLGCGGSRIDKLPLGFQSGFREIRLDINSDVQPDICLSANELHKLPSHAYDALYSSHMIEHVNAFEVTPLLAQFKRILKPDGFAVLTCPDIMPIAEQILRGGILQPAYKCNAGLIYPADVMFGYQKEIEAGNDYMAHRYFFTDASLKAHCEAAGFSTINVRRRIEKLDLWAICQPNNATNSDHLMQHFTFE
jgi:predicted SAM-dependent methyltransferase